MKRSLAVATLVLVVLAVSIPVLGDTPEHKILICHLPPGNPENGQAIEIDRNAWEQGGPPGHHAEGNHGGDFEIKDDDDLKRCEGKEETTTTKRNTTTTKHDDTTTTKHETTTTRRDETTTTDKDTTTTKPDETTTTKPDETTTTKEETTTTDSTTTTTEPTTTTTEGSTTTSEDSTTTTTEATTSTTEGTTSTTEGTTTTTTTAPPTTPPTLQAGNVTAVCVSNIPFFAYEILNFPEGTLLSEIRFENPEPGGADLVYVNQPLTGQVLWPGASADPEDWPGWILNEDGIWVEGDDGFLWARESVQVTFTINPSVTVTVTYPPASAICAGPVNPAITTTPGSTAPDGVTTTRAGVLPFTGSELLALGYLAGATFLLGLILLVSARKQES